MMCDDVTGNVPGKEEECDDVTGQLRNTYQQMKEGDDFQPPAFLRGGAA